MMTKPSHVAFMACEKAFSMLLFLDYFLDYFIVIM